MRVLWIFFSLSLTNCALVEDRKGPASFTGPREQVYTASFDEIWRATNLVTQAYPLRVSNMDQGLIETDTMRGDKLWTPPYKPEGSTHGESYRLVIRVAKGALNGKPATKVSILKDLKVQADFFSDPKGKPSDGLEEKTLLYRIGRELQIDRALVKAVKKFAK